MDKLRESKSIEEYANSEWLQEARKWHREEMPITFLDMSYNSILASSALILAELSAKTEDISRVSMALSLLIDVITTLRLTSGDRIALASAFILGTCISLDEIEESNTVLFKE